jgi:hypothetical protein
MKKKLIVILIIIGSIGALVYSCVSNTKENARMDTTAVGKWEGLIVGINMPPIQFNGAKIFMDFSGKDSVFNIVARDTSKIASPDIKDTILVLTGAWRQNAPQDSVLLSPSACRALDTGTHTLSSRPAQEQPIPIPKFIEKKETSIIWEISFADLAPLVPLLGLTIPESQIGLLKMLVIDLEKKSQ